MFGKLRLDLTGTKAIDVILGLLYIAIAYQMNVLRKTQTMEGIFYLALLLFCYYMFVNYRGIYNNQKNQRTYNGSND